MANFVNGAENWAFSNIAASTNAFDLMGGQYGITATATWGGGSVVLSRLSADGSTYVPVITAFTANGYTYTYLPPGVYRFTIATATAVYCDVTAIFKGGPY